MKVRLISKTIAEDWLKEEGVNTPTDLIAYCARVSNPNNQYNMETAEKLLQFLIRHSHWSPLEMVDVTFEIETTRDIGRQILRHRSFVFQEFSQRYAKSEACEFSEARLQDEKNRQNSLPTEDKELQAWWYGVQRDVWAHSHHLYKRAIHKGIAKEVARKILPEGLTMSRMYMKGSVRSWIHYLQLRTHESTQIEHREIAYEIAKIINELFPLNRTKIDK